MGSKTNLGHKYISAKLLKGRKLEFGPWSSSRYKSIRDFTIALMLRVDRVENGRNIGFDYEHILKSIHRRFPLVTYKGPHMGRPSKMSYDELWEITRYLNFEGVVLPVRPRRQKPKIKISKRARRKKSKVKS